MTEPTTFLMQKDWGDMIALLSPSQKADLLDAIYAYQINGEVIEIADPMVKITFVPMLKFFKGAEEQYRKKCITNSLNVQKRYAKKDGDKERQKEIKEKKRFIADHTSEEYTTEYDRKGTYTKATNTNTNTNINTSTIANTSASTLSKPLTDSDINTLSDSDAVDGDYKGKESVSIEELLNYCEEHGYTFDARKVYRAKTKPLYQDELKEACDTWEALQKI